MKSIENVLLDFYTCVHIPVQFLDQTFNSIFNIDIQESIKDFINSTSLYHDLKQGIDALTTLTYFENIHFIVLPLQNYRQLTGYFIAGPFQSINLGKDNQFAYKPFDCLSYLGKLFENIMRQHLFSAPKFNTYVREGIYYIHKNYDKNITLTGEAGRFKVEYDKKLLSPATDTVELTDPKLIHSWNRKKLTRIRFTIVSQQISGESKLVIRKVQYHKTLND